MELLLDTANLKAIRKYHDYYAITGVTTNPSLIAKEGLDYYTTLKKIASMTDGPVFGEVKATATLAEDIIKEAREIYAIAPKNMVVKIPMNTEGLKAISALKKEGIPTNCTLIFSANQALLAALAGASYVSLFVGRLDDIGQKNNASRLRNAIFSVTKDGKYTTADIGGTASTDEFTNAVISLL